MSDYTLYLKFPDGTTVMTIDAQSPDVAVVSCCRKLSDFQFSELLSIKVFEFPLPEPRPLSTWSFGIK